MKVEQFHSQPLSKSLVILLPGIGDKPESFVENGAVAKILECNSNTSIVGVEAHFGYYKEKAFVQRLKQDVIEPAIKKGINNIWLMGISLGGFGSLLYREDYPQDIKGVVILAPYLGKDKSLEAYLSQQKDSKHFPDEGRQAFWQYLEKTAQLQPSISLAYGLSDKFAPLNSWLAKQLPQNQVVTQKGRHNWRTWKALWPEVLQKSGFCG